MVLQPRSNGAKSCASAFLIGWPQYDGLATRLVLRFVGVNPGRERIKAESTEEALRHRVVVFARDRLL